MTDTDSGMRRPIALVGIGEMGGVFARAFLRAGHSVHPVLRTSDPEVIATRVPEPLLALVTVGESDLPDTLADLPVPWRGRVGLIQNELLPRDWLAAGIDDPTVAVVWFEKKPGTDVKVIIPTPVHGPAAGEVAAALEAIGIPATVLNHRMELEDALVLKNVYILTANIAGLETRGTVGDLWDNHRELAASVAREVLSIQSFLVGRELDSDALIAGMADTFAADPDHGATGRSAPMRLARALGHAASAGVEVPRMEEIGRSHPV